MDDGFEVLPVDIFNISMHNQRRLVMSNLIKEIFKPPNQGAGLLASGIPIVPKANEFAVEVLGLSDFFYRSNRMGLKNISVDSVRDI